MEQLESQKVVCIGGLNSNVNHIQLSDNEPGSAVDLLNFESSLYGGYRRISGYQPLNEDYPEVDSVGAEGKVLVVAIFGSDIITARKQKSSNTYEFYRSTGSGWTKYVTGLTRSSLNVVRLRFATFNFDGTDKIIFVDGVNPACMFDGTTWTEIKTANTGANYANAGGDQAINNPSYVAIFKNHVFLAADHIVFHSAPLAEYNWKAAGGAGQLPAGYDVNQIKMFRDALFVFGQNNIKKIEVANTDFVLGEIVSNIGNVAPDSVVEIGGSLLFLSQDGFRPISGTNRIGDVEIETVSKKIQQLVNTSIQSNSMADVCTVLVRGKSQVRLFFSNEGTARDSTFGIIGCLRSSGNGVSWEWMQSKGIRASCATSGYIGNTEYVLHGDYDGKVHRQELGSSFDGDYIPAVYSTPYLDFGNAGIRKTLRKIRLFIRPEGRVTVTTKLTFDWADPIKLNPSTYFTSTNTSDQVTSIYDTAVYDTDVYAEYPTPVLLQNTQGSGFSVQMTYATYGTEPSYTIQGAVYEFNVEGRK